MDGPLSSMTCQDDFFWSVDGARDASQKNEQSKWLGEATLNLAEQDLTIAKTKRSANLCLSCCCCCSSTSSLTHQIVLLVWFVWMFEDFQDLPHVFDYLGFVGCLLVCRNWMDIFAC